MENSASGHSDNSGTETIGSSVPEENALPPRANRAAGMRAVPMTNELPDLPMLWARWAVLAAVFVAIRSARGPRIAPSLGWFESSRRAGSTLHLLSEGRAVLSGGVWNSPVSEKVYHDENTTPNFYRGAPDWVTDSVVNPRAAVGLLSFCYWWDSGLWWRGESPPAEHSSSAVPGVWTADAVFDIVASVLPYGAGDLSREAVEGLLISAEARTVSRDALSAVFADSDRFDIDGAMLQLSSAGCTSGRIRLEIPESDAMAVVRAYVIEQQLDTTGYQLSQLKADRISGGWMVYVPVPRGQIAVGRAIFYVADDGILEHSSSSTPPSAYIVGFEQRYRRRNGLST